MERYVNLYYGAPQTLISIWQSLIQPLLQKSLRERRQLLREHFQEVDKEFQFAKASDGETVDEIQSFLEESVKDGCEGLMVKMLESEASHYEPSRRSVNWLKVNQIAIVSELQIWQLFVYRSRKTI